jgi:hypothetical protein
LGKSTKAWDLPGVIVTAIMQAKNIKKPKNDLRLRRRLAMGSIPETGNKLLLFSLISSHDKFCHVSSDQSILVSLFGARILIVQEPI